ncbi:glycosyltransferase [Sutcliffiella deserti]|uniref:glycosyltransferase n=1 Tax=Sutcliffiella deserti TaxID=2875501 RepID=UPI001CBC47D0|nr:glycosyltransferase [Sutcliffiella deserti]
MEKPLVTFMISTYNCDTTIDEAFESIANQTYKNFLVKIIDDNSKDHTLEKVKNWCERDERFQLINIHKENTGLTSSLNEILESVDTPYAARMDADDICLPERLEKQMKYLEEHPEISVLGTWAKDIDENGTFIRDRRVPTDHFNIRKVIVKASPMIHPSVIMKTEHLKDVTGYNTSYRVAQDIDLWFRFIGKGYKLANIPEYLMLYRVITGHAKKRGIKHRWLDAKIRWRGTRVIESTPMERMTAVSIPILLGIMPSFVTSQLMKYSKYIDPRQKTQKTKK